MSTRDKIQREILPIPDIAHVGLTTYDAKDPDTKYPPIVPLRPPKGAPNVLIVLLDDVGFGASSAFGGPCHTPTAERLAANGLQLQSLSHDRALLADRQALLTGRNHHTVGMGGITEMATSAPGNCSIRPKSCAPLAETLKLNGYATAQFGKCHEVPCWETSPAGPYDAWPTGSGFEYFYGFMCAETNQYYPSLYEGTTPVELEKTPEEGYHLTEDLANHAIQWVRRQKSLMPDKPFFMYFAPGATHAPHHVPTEWSAKYKGKFDQGWDKLREETFARQKQLGVIPPEAELTKRHPEIPAWDEIAGRDEADPGAPDGDLCRVPGTHRLSRRAADRCAGGPGDPRRYPDLLHHRRQRRLGRRHAPGHVQRDAADQWVRLSRDPGIPERAHRQVRRAEGLQSLCRRLGARHGHAVPVDQADRLALGRHAQRHDRPLAQGDQGQRRDPQPVLPRDRRGADGHWKRRGCPSRPSSTASSRSPTKG